MYSMVGTLRLKLYKFDMSNRHYGSNALKMKECSICHMPVLETLETKWIPESVGRFLTLLSNTRIVEVKSHIRARSAFDLEV
jgi:hypothetical protein